MTRHINPRARIDADLNECVQDVGQTIKIQVIFGTVQNLGTCDDGNRHWLRMQRMVNLGRRRPQISDQYACVDGSYLADIAQVFDCLPVQVDLSCRRVE